VISFLERKRHWGIGMVTEEQMILDEVYKYFS
jgi:hypothetical protein